MGVEGPFLFVFMGGIALICGILASGLSRFMTRRRCVAKRSRRIAVAASVSVLPVFGLAVAMPTRYDWSDPLYIFAMLLPVFLMCAFMAVLVSAPAAWLASRPRQGVLNADIFE